MELYAVGYSFLYFDKSDRVELIPIAERKKHTNMEKEIWSNEVLITSREIIFQIHLTLWAQIIYTWAS